MALRIQNTSSSSNLCLGKGGYSFMLFMPHHGYLCVEQVVVNHRIDKHTPRFDVQLLFDEIGVALDRDQYRDVLSLLDMYHVYLRQHQVEFRLLPVWVCHTEFL